MPRRRSAPWRVDVLAFPGSFGTEVFAIIDVLAIANAVSAVLRPGTEPPLRARVVSVRGTRITLAGGSTLQTECVATLGQDTDQLVVPGFEFFYPARLDELLAGWAPEVAQLSKLGSAGIDVASICGGAFLLAQAGLLDGHTATTSWLFAPEFARRYPAVAMTANAMLVADGRITTSAAFSAGLDLALHIVAARAGAHVARATSNVTLASDTRRTQAPFVDESMLPTTHSRFSDDVRDRLRHHITEPYDLVRLAAEFNVSTRTMLRRFAAETGESPLAFLQRIRISAAKRLLETSGLSVHTIVGQVGYADAATFRRLFTTLVGTTPSQYRRQFQHQP